MHSKNVQREAGRGTWEVPQSINNDRAATAQWLVAHYATPPDWVWIFTGPRPGWKHWGREG